MSSWPRWPKESQKGKPRDAKLMASDDFVTAVSPNSQNGKATRPRKVPRETAEEDFLLAALAQDSPSGKNNERRSCIKMNPEEDKDSRIKRNLET